MANFSGIAATGRSLESLLNAWFQQQEPVPDKKTKAVLARAADFDATKSTSAIGSPALSILLYQVDVNKTMRAAWSAVSSQDGCARVPLDLHYLLTPWADNAEYEHRILGAAIECLETTPILSGPLLNSLGKWAPGESVQLVFDEAPAEALVRTFETLGAGYRLSVAYMARLVRLDTRQASPDRPATAIVTGARAGVDE